MLPSLTAPVLPRRIMLVAPILRRPYPDLPFPPLSVYPTCCTRPTQVGVLSWASPSRMQWVTKWLPYTELLAERRHTLSRYEAADAGQPKAVRAKARDAILTEVAELSLTPASATEIGRLLASSWVWNSSS